MSPGIHEMRRCSWQSTPAPRRRRGVGARAPRCAKPRGPRRTSQTSSQSPKPPCNYPGWGSGRRDGAGRLAGRSRAARCGPCASAPRRPHKVCRQAAGQRPGGRPRAPFLVPESPLLRPPPVWWPWRGWGWALPPALPHAEVSRCWRLAGASTPPPTSQRHSALLCSPPAPSAPPPLLTDNMAPAAKVRTPAAARARGAPDPRRRLCARPHRAQHHISKHWAPGAGGKGPRARWPAAARQCQPE